jgi:hypothetical protein
MWEKSGRLEEAKRVRGEVPIEHRYTVGLAGERFFREMRDRGRLLASRCPSCRQAFLPPRIYCERCFEETGEWIPVEGPGYVKGFTVLHLSLEEERLEEPAVVALVGWEGVRGGLIHRLGEVRAEEVRIGIPVEPVWAEERTGSLKDIMYFRPVGNPSGWRKG